MKMNILVKIKIVSYEQAIFSSQACIENASKPIETKSTIPKAVSERDACSLPIFNFKHLLSVFLQVLQVCSQYFPALSLAQW